MNYEALGRYTEAVENAKSAAIHVRDAFARLGRLTICQDTGSKSMACEFDFAKIQDAVDEAQAAHIAMLAAVASANHEAAACERPALSLYRIQSN